MSSVKGPLRAVHMPLWALIFREGTQCDISRACLLTIFPMWSTEGRGHSYEMLVGWSEPRLPALVAKAFLWVTLVYLFNSHSG